MTNNYNYNPIAWVKSQSGTQEEIPCPSSYQWKLEDISSNNAGRTEDTKMHKERIGQVINIELSWLNLSIEEASVVLKAFNPEYITVCYLDAMEGNYKESEFYVGNRTSPLYNSKKGVWSKISFNIIERDGRKENV